MFGPIENTALTDKVANSYFDSRPISVSMYGPSHAVSLSLLRAFGLARPEFDGHIVIRRAAVSSLLDTFEELCDHTFMIGITTSGVMDKVQDELDGYTEVQKVNNFYKDSYSVRAFTNGNKSILIADGRTKDIDVKDIHYLLASIVPLMPFVIDPESVSPDEMEMVTTLMQEDPREFIDCINNIVSKYDMRTEYLRKGMSSFSETRRKNSLKSFERQIKQYQEQIEDRERNLTSLYDSLRKTNREYQVAKEEYVSSDELMEYMLDQKCIDITNFGKMAFDDDAYVDYVVHGDLTNWDRDVAESFCQYKRSIVYTPNSDIDINISREDVGRLFKSIFIDEIVKVQFAYGFRLTTGMHFELNYNRDNKKYANYMPNPHLFNFNCLGDNSRYIQQALRQNDLIGAMEQSIYAVFNMDLEDLSFSKFMDDLYTDRYACFRLPNGDVVYASEAIAYLKEKEGKEDGETN